MATVSCKIVVVNLPQAFSDFLRKELIFHHIELFPLNDPENLANYVQTIRAEVVVAHLDPDASNHQEILTALQSLSREKELWMLLIVRDEDTVATIQNSFKNTHLFIQKDSDHQVTLRNLLTIKQIQQKLRKYDQEKFYQENLNNCYRIVFREKSLQNIFEKLIQLLPKSVSMDYWALFALDKQIQRIEYFAQFIPPIHRKSVVLTPQLEKLIQGWVDNASPFLITEKESPSLFNKLNQLGWQVKLIYFIPIVLKEKIIGGMVLGSTGAEQLNSREIRFLNEINQMLVQRILEENLTHQDREEIGIFSDTLISNHLNEEAIFQHTCKTLSDITKCDSSIFWQHNKGFGFLFPKYFHFTAPNTWEEFPEKQMVFLEKEKYLSQLLNRGESKKITDIDREPRLADATRKMFSNLHYRNILLIPIRMENEVVGTIILNKTQPGAEFSLWDMQKAEEIVNRTRVVLETARKAKEANLKLKQLARIFELGGEITLGLNLPEIVNRITQSIRKALGWNDVAVLLEDELGVKLQVINRVGFKGNLNLGLDFTEDIFVPEIDALLKRCERISNSFFCNAAPPTLLDDPNSRPNGSIEWGESDLLFVPLKTRDKVMGYLVVHDPVDRLKPTEEKIIPLEYYANQAAVAVENSLLYEKLRASQERYRSLAETMSLGLVTCDRQGKVVYANPAFQQLLGYEEDQVIARELTNYFAPRKVPELQKVIARLLDVDSDEHTRIENLEFDVISQSGEAIPVSVFGFPLFELQEKTGFFLILNDLRYIKRLERMKADFNSMIVHDLRSPMNVIQGFIELIRNRVVGEINTEQEELLDIAKENVKKVLSLVDNFLVASKLDVGKFTIEPKLDEINALIEQQVENHKVLVKNKNIRIEMELDHNLPLLLFDSLRIEQVLNNLLSNAMKFTPENGSIHVCSRLIKKQLEGEEKYFASVSVKDTGMGIPPEKLPHIFEKYEQVEDGQQFNIRGTGLGLSICKEIVELHGGEITVESKPNKGSIFTFVLPIESSIEKIVK